MEMPKIQTRLEVRAEENSDVAELYLYGVIRQAYWWEEEDDCISAKGVKRRLEALKGKDINVHINSGGGDVFESIAICNLFKQHDGNIDIYIDSMAGSGASIIATSGKNVYMFTNSMQMIHKAWTIVLGNADELRKTAGDLDKIDAAVKASYMSKFVGTEEELEKLIADETYLTAEECLAFGLCTKIIDEKKEEEVVENSIKDTLFNKYRKEVKAEVGEVKPTLFNAFKKHNVGGNE
ncbi:ATP-dependent protease ClpP protease subunit [Anaerosolibacter carboniphilus]|uniref:ATP-dependent protease ClpP protease subunit n=1 Tax=Anaerosolibacter carboniphilus TaxID=1417629 RepID=A0A841KXS4_9FIRM|nr:head maturation protease, ClpP-related [Anaerosolibacter carboniphilus]MBB6214969.1 ATP-dependent protease ClpP protease subunit [Anaerosolibacter carboniphilus]